MKNTYKLPVTLTRFTNFDIDFDKLIDSINKYNHDSKPDLVKTEVTNEIFSNGQDWLMDCYEEATTEEVS